MHQQKYAIRCKDNEDVRLLMLYWDSIWWHREWPESLIREEYNREEPYMIFDITKQNVVHCDDIPSYIQQGYTVISYKEAIEKGLLGEKINYIYSEVPTPWVWSKREPIKIHEVEPQQNEVQESPSEDNLVELMMEDFVFLFYNWELSNIDKFKEWMKYVLEKHLIYK